MTTKLLALVHSKVALAVLGVLLVSGSGAAVVAANHGQNPSTQASAQATHTPAADSGNHGHTVSLEGQLTAYHAAAKTIRGCTRRLAAWADGFTDQTMKRVSPQNME